MESKKSKISIIRSVTSHCQIAYFHNYTLLQYTYYVVAEVPNPALPCCSFESVSGLVDANVSWYANLSTAFSHISECEHTYASKI